MMQRLAGLSMLCIIGAILRVQFPQLKYLNILFFTNLFIYFLAQFRNRDELMPCDSNGPQQAGISCS